jgi:predicted membrane-bound spermidine synthase/Na+-translocating ferredoxin:NAD+ oxidoreductase RnfG subunit
MRFARTLIIFSYGLFTIAAQTLVFRQFISTFESNDISVGIFFSTWFLWIAAGAVVVYKNKGFAEKLLKNIEFVFLCYLPAFVVQLILIIQARSIAGIKSYTLLSISDIVLLSLVVNAPVSFITGILFPTACRWIKLDQRFAVSHVYIIEAAGSFAGGLGVTILLTFGLSSARIFFILAIIVSFSTFVVYLFKRTEQNTGIIKSGAAVTCSITFLIPFCFILGLMFGVDNLSANYIDAVRWSKLLPKDAFAGSFQTAQAEYLYGVYNGQWVAVREGSTIETLPNESANGRIAAISLCQNPNAKKILVIGSGLGLCYEFLKLPQIEQITWTHFDNEYIQAVERFIPPQFKKSDKRLRKVAGDVRPLLTEEKQYYDIVILNLPEATSSVLNRYYTLEFYEQVKKALRPGGILSVRITGGENIMGTELINLGASTKLTLEKVFSKLVLAPGDDTWLIVSDSAELTGQPGVLQDRFAAIKNSSEIFAPQGLLSVYLPDRAQAALKNYSSPDLPQHLLINTDSKPLASLYSLLFAAKQSGAPVAKLVKRIALAGPIVFFIPLLIFVVLRIIYVLKTSHRDKPSSFDSSFLVFSAGWTGIGFVIVLIYLYQTRFGSLYLHIGAVSSLFMVGLTAGALFISGLMKRIVRNNLPATNEVFILGTILSNVIIIAAISYLQDERWSHLLFGSVFFLCGVCVGCYFPLAAGQLAGAGFEVGLAGRKLEIADHIGASVGGFLVSLVLIPVLGIKITLFVTIVFILSNVPFVLLKRYRYTSKRDYVFTTDASILRSLRYVLFGIAVFVIVCSDLLVRAGANLKPSLPGYAVQALAGDLHFREVSKSFDNNRREIKYFEVYDNEGKLDGYIYSSQDLAPEVRGFGGKINLAVYVDPGGKLINFQIIQTNETPGYLNMLSKWLPSLNDHSLFDSKPFPDIQAVTGATVSSKAVLSALQKSGQRFAAQILGRFLQSDAKKIYRAGYLPDIQGIYLISAVIFTLIVIYYGGFWSRLAVLFYNLVIGGILLNAQYSSEQITTILSLHIPAIGFTGTFLLIFGISILVMMFGNIYCGYICPFGAAQELLGFIIPKRFKQVVSADAMKTARFIKYMILFILIMVFFISRNHSTLAADPLISAFNLRFTQHDFKLEVLLIISAALIGSVFYTRFWCRYLCPAGAFLSLFNMISILKKHLPIKIFNNCPFGLTSVDKVDCLYCDKCRYEKHISERAKEGKTAKLFLTCVFAAGIIVATVSVSRFLDVMPTEFDKTTSSISAGGQPRDVDLQRIQKMIQQKRLSDKEAQFYKKAE